MSPPFLSGRIYYTPVWYKAQLFVDRIKPIKHTALGEGPWFSILANTQNTLTVHSDLRTDYDGADSVEVGDAFEIFDLHLEDHCEAVDWKTLCFAHLGN
jgi:hypothetical protein